MYICRCNRRRKILLRICRKYNWRDIFIEIPEFWALLSGQNYHQSDSTAPLKNLRFEQINELLISGVLLHLSADSLKSVFGNVSEFIRKEMIFSFYRLLEPVCFGSWTYSRDRSALITHLDDRIFIFCSCSQVFGLSKSLRRLICRISVTFTTLRYLISSGGKLSVMFTFLSKPVSLTL